MTEKDEQLEALESWLDYGILATAQCQFCDKWFREMSLEIYLERARPILVKKIYDMGWREIKDPRKSFEGLDHVILLCPECLEKQT